MITLHPPKTKKDQILSQIEETLDLATNQAKAIAYNINLSMDIFWNADDEILLEILNEKGVEEMQRIFTAHEENATNINKLLESRGVDPICKIGMRRNLKVDEAGIFSIEYPVEEPVVEDPIIEDPVIE